MNIEKLFKKKTPSTFEITEDSNELLLHELIISAALNDKPKFEEILKMPILLDVEFSVKKEYSYHDDGAGPSILEDSAYSTFLHSALTYMPDEYCNLVVRKMIDEKNIIKNDKSIWWYTHIIDRTLKRNLESTFASCVEAGIIDDTRLKKTIFFYQYDDFKDIAIETIADNPEKLSEIFLQVFDDKILKNVPSGYSNRFMKINSLIEDVADIPGVDLYTLKPHLLKFLYEINKERGDLRNAIKEIFLTGIAYSIYETHTSYKHNNEEVELFKHFKISDAELQKALTIQVQRFKEKLDNELPNAKNIRRVKV